VQIKQYRAVILIASAALALMIVSPTIGSYLVIPQTSPFTEMALLDGNRTTNYPSNISTGEKLGLFLEITNHMNSLSYYVVEVKFRNESQASPNSFEHTASDLDPLARFTVIVADEETVQLPIYISFNYSINQLAERMVIQSISLNDLPIKFESSLYWNPETKGYFGNLFFELYKYNDTTNAMQYHQRYVGLWLKLI